LFAHLQDAIPNAPEGLAALPRRLAPSALRLADLEIWLLDRRLKHQLEKEGDDHGDN